MSVRPLCLEPHPALRAAAKPVGRVTQEIRRLARDMIDTMYAYDGIGLAAPQVGEALQLFVASPTQERGREIVMVNPVLEPVRGQASMMEGCLSLPNVWDRVRRSQVVRLRGQDLSGKPVEMEVDGLLAIVLQHEVDHLQGRLFIDRLSWLRRKKALLSLRRGGRTPARRASDPTPD